MPEDDPAFLEWASELATPRKVQDELRATHLKQIREMLEWYGDPEFPLSMTIDFDYRGRKYRGTVHRIDEGKTNE